MAACADTGTHYVDLGGLFHTTRRQLALHDRFVAAGVTAVIGMGSSPGSTNVMAAYAACGLASVEEVHVRVGIAGVPIRAAPLSVPFAIDTLLDEFSVPAVTYADGGWAEVPAMSGLEEIGFPAPVGRLMLGHSLHSEVATLPLFFAHRGVRTVSFKIGFPAAFVARMRLLTNLGLARTEPLEVDRQRVAPREVLRRCIETTTPARPPKARPGDVEALVVRLTGQDRNERHLEVLAECVVRPHPTWGAGAGELGTGVPPSIVAQFLARGAIDRPGVFAPEDIVPPEPYFEELAGRSMMVDLITRTAAADDPARGWPSDAWSRPLGIGSPSGFWRGAGEQAVTTDLEVLW
jgi:lysine 6-dehydrogenase